MIRCIRKLFTLAVVLVLLAAFGYSVVLPRVLPLQYRDIVEQYAAEYGLEEAFVYGVIFCESHFEPDVISSADAVGLMQVTEETGKWAAAQMGLDPATIDLTDPDTNIHIGCGCACKRIWRKLRLVCMQTELRIWKEMKNDEKKDFSPFADFLPWAWRLWQEGGANEEENDSNRGDGRCIQRGNADAFHADSGNAESVAEQRRNG